MKQKRYEFITMFRDDQAIQVDFIVQPPDHDVGIMTASAEDVCVVDLLTKQAITDLTEDESALIDDQCLDYAQRCYDDDVADYIEALEAAEDR